MQSDVTWVREQVRKGHLTCLGFSGWGVIHAGSDLSLQISHRAGGVSQPGDREALGQRGGGGIAKTLYQHRIPSRLSSPSDMPAPLAVWLGQTTSLSGHNFSISVTYTLELRNSSAVYSYFFRSSYPLVRVSNFYYLPIRITWAGERVS